MNCMSLLTRGAAFFILNFLILLKLQSQCLTAGPQSGSFFSNDISIGSFAFATPSNAQTSDNNRSTATAIAALFTGNTNYLNVSGLGFSIPPATTICGIMVEVEKSASGISVLATVSDNVIQLMKNGTLTGSNYATSTDWTATDAYYTYGGSSDLWGSTWTTADINSANFGVALSAQINGLAFVFPSARIDHIRVTVYYNFVTVPVKLMRFSGDLDPAGQARLSWALTGNGEETVIHLQKKYEHDSWITIYSTTSKVTSVAQSYEYTDNNMGRSGADYRLEMVSSSGASSFSSIVHVEGKINSRFVVYPVPARDMIQLSCPENIHHIACMGIDGIDYQLVFQKYGGNLYQADISRLRSGIYFTKVNDTRLKFVKQ